MIAAHRSSGAQQGSAIGACLAPKWWLSGRMRSPDPCKIKRLNGARPAATAAAFIKGLSPLLPVAAAGRTFPSLCAAAAHRVFTSIGFYCYVLRTDAHERRSGGV